MLRFKMMMALIACIVAAASAQSDYTQIMAVKLTPRPDKIAAFEAGLAAHNKKYHTADPFKASVFAVVVGKGTGSYWYDMGPCTLADMDARKTSPEHDTDWNNNVMAHCSEHGEAGYWRVDKDIRYEAEGSANFTKTRLRFFTLKPGQRDRAEVLLMKFTEVLKQKKFPVGYNIYWRFETSDGPDLAAAMSFAGWGFLDRYEEIEAGFDEVHGKGSYALFLEDLGNTVDLTTAFDQHIEYMPNLSSPQ